MGGPQKAAGVQQQYSTGWRQREQRELENRAKSEKSSFYIILVYYFSVFNHNWYTFILGKFKSQITIMQSHHPEIIAVPFLLPT